MEIRSSKSVIKVLAISLVVLGSVMSQGASNTPYAGVMKKIPYTTIRFTPTSSVLSDADKLQLRQISNDAHGKGQIETTIIAAWSDRNFPRAGVTLSRADRDLANQRADAIKNFLKNELNFSSLDTYNMAENSNWLARTLHTSDAKMKAVFSKKGAEAPVTHAEFNIIRNEGGPGKVVIVIENK